MLLDERYRTLELIGEGASAWVYRADDAVTGTVVAIKLLKPALQTDAVTVERFRREIQIARRIGHPGIVSIFDLVHTPEHTFLVMEHLPGANLKQHAALHHPLAPAAALALLVQVLEVLAACHARGVVHRDLKPQNVIVAADGSLKVLDFGLARMTGLSDLTQTGTAPAGSPEYMAPELFRGGLPDPRTDLYAAGCIAYELLAGRPPFRADSVAALARHHLETPVPSLADGARVPTWLAHVVERLLAKRGFERYQTAGEALADIARRRVVARELPALPRRECPRCGDETLADLSVCLACGWDALAVLEPGDRDVLRTPATDPQRLAAYARALFGAAAPTGRRTLLLAGIAPEAAAVIGAGAAARDLPLQIRRRSPWRELRKALPLALLCLIASGLAQTVVARWQFYGASLRYALEPAQLLQLTLAIVLGWVCARRFRQEEAVPAWSGAAARPGAAALPELRSALTPERDPELRALVASLVERLLLLERRGPRLDAATRASLEQAVVAAARLAATLSEARALLTAAALVRRVQRALAEARARDRDGDGPAAATLRAYYGLEERTAALHQRLIAVQALFAGAVGRALVLRQPFDDAARAALADCGAGLAADLAVARAVQRELEALA